MAQSPHPNEDRALARLLRSLKQRGNLPLTHSDALNEVDIDNIMLALDLIASPHTLMEMRERLFFTFI